MRILGLILVIAGALALGYQGFTYVTRDTVASTPIGDITKKQEHNVWIPPVVGGIGVAAGLVLMVVGGRKEA